MKINAVWKPSPYCQEDYTSGEMVDQNQPNDVYVFNCNVNCPQVSKSKFTGKQTNTKGRTWVYSMIDVATDDKWILPVMKNKQLTGYMLIVENFDKHVLIRQMTCPDFRSSLLCENHVSPNCQLELRKSRTVYYLNKYYSFLNPKRNTSSFSLSKKFKINKFVDMWFALAFPYYMLRVFPVLKNNNKTK